MWVILTFNKIKPSAIFATFLVLKLDCVSGLGWG